MDREERVSDAGWILMLEVAGARYRELATEENGPSRILSFYHSLLRIRLMMIRYLPLNATLICDT